MQIELPKRSAEFSGLQRRKARLRRICSTVRTAFRTTRTTRTSATDAIAVLEGLERIAGS
jgi:hypothetical protein